MNLIQQQKRKWQQQKRKWQEKQKNIKPNQEIQCLSCDIYIFSESYTYD